jgi:DNA replication initiation complex subunit (GINS family)
LTDHYTRLLEWRRAEGSTRGLAKLPQDFYPATEAYLAEARRTFESELRSNPAGKKGELARQTYGRAAQIARDILEARMMKILNLAFQASVGGARELTNSLAEERELYDHLLATLRAHRGTVAPFLEPTSPAPPPTVAIPDAARTAAPTSTPPSLPPGQVLVRILQDRPAIEVEGGTVALRKEDLVSLPAEVAKLLVLAKVAARVDASER